MESFSGGILPEGNVVVKFFANWCGPCKMLGPRLETISTEFSNVKFLEVDADKSAQYVAENNVHGLPTVAFFKDGKEQSRLIGLKRMSDYEDEIKKLLGIFEPKSE